MNPMQSIDKTSMLMAAPAETGMRAEPARTFTRRIDCDGARRSDARGAEAGHERGARGAGRR